MGGIFLLKDGNKLDHIIASARGRHGRGHRDSGGTGRREATVQVMRFYVSDRRQEATLLP